MRGGIFWLVIGAFIGAYLALNNTEAAGWFANIFEMLRANLGGI
jgi:hypothetical protein